MSSSKRLTPVLALLAAPLLMTALRAAPTLNPGLWRFRYHIQGLGGMQNKTKTMTFCYKKPQPVKPSGPKECVPPAPQVQGSTARWTVACTLNKGPVAMHIHSQGVIVYLDGGNAFRETTVTHMVMPGMPGMPGGMRGYTYNVRVTGRRVGACP